MSDVPDEWLPALTDLLAGAGTDLAGPVRAQVLTVGRSNLTAVLDDGAHRWVMRTPPRAGRTPSAHDVAREFTVTSALHAHGFPVPRPIVVCGEDSAFGSPLAVWEFVDGLAVQTQQEIAALDDHQVAGVIDSLVATLARLHVIDHVEIGLAGFGRAEGYAERQLRRWSGQWQLVGAEADAALADEVIAGLRTALPRQVRASIVHGDYRIDNTLLDRDTFAVRVVVDWELSTIGDPSADLAMMCAFRLPALDLILGGPTAWTDARMPGVDEFAERYAAHGHDLVDWDRHLALAYFKVAVIAAGIEHRRRAGIGHGPGFANAGESVPHFLEAARARLA